MRYIKQAAISAIGLAAFLLFRPIEAVYHYWSKCISGEISTARMVWTEEAYAEDLISSADALQILLPHADQRTEEIHRLTDEQVKTIERRAHVTFDPEFSREFHFHIGRSNGVVTAYAVEDTVHGKWGPIRYMIIFDPAGKVLDVIVLEYQEKRGRPVAERRFLKQFVGKKAGDNVRLNKDIRSVTGASMSSGGMANGIRKMIHVFGELYGSQS